MLFDQFQTWFWLQIIDLIESWKVLIHIVALGFFFFFLGEESYFGFPGAISTGGIKLLLSELCSSTQAFLLSNLIRVCVNSPRGSWAGSVYAEFSYLLYIVAAGCDERLRCSAVCHAQAVDLLSCMIVYKSEEMNMLCDLRTAVCKPEPWSASQSANNQAFFESWEESCYNCWWKGHPKNLHPPRPCIKTFNRILHVTHI